MSDFQWYRILRGGLWLCGSDVWNRGPKWFQVRPDGFFSYFGCNVNAELVRRDNRESWTQPLPQRLNLLRPRVTPLRLMIAAVVCAVVMGVW